MNGKLKEVLRALIPAAVIVWFGITVTGWIAKIPFIKTLGASIHALIAYTAVIMIVGLIVAKIKQLK